MAPSGSYKFDKKTAIRPFFETMWYLRNYQRQSANDFENGYRQLLQEGTFEAYNQWLFGSVQNLAAYQNWTLAHPDENDAFVKFQRGRIFKVPAGQYYR